ncbi:MAG: carboxy terminal-processing peptidase, partial [Saprospiraceae bacterium]|nr:carboxy terminal-processing peptidase [Saprospiraceae bacterium]
NDEFSEKVFNLYLDRTDHNKNFFLKEDIEALKKYTHLIDNEVKDKSFEFFNLSLEIINQRILESKDYYKEILAKPFDFTKNESIELEGDKKDWAKNKDEIKENWRKALKYQTLIRLVDMMQVQEKALEKSDTVETKTFEQMEIEARAKILERQNDWFRRMEQFERKDRISLFFNCITNLYDPHTGYFPPKDKEDFDIAMSGKLEGIGATLQEQDGYVKVVAIVTGSASWKQGELKAGDLILKVAQGDDEAVDIVDMRLDEAVKLIRGKKGTKVRLTVKKIDGTITEISIIRDVVIIEETYAKSAVIKDKDEKKSIGYIYLPRFYVDFNDVNGRRCSDDIEKELEKLEGENIEGLIFDLRNNGGGSLPDVVKIAGLFIEKGPIVQIKSRYGNPEVQNDDDSNVKYAGPLVILVNEFSASASEIFAAAMQDYKRAIIIGSTSTFGKGTVQRFFDLDNFINTQADDIKPLGAIKITTQKFYRINGGATQLKGVKSDIILPDIYTYFDIGEKEMDYPMQWSEIPAVEYKPWVSTYSLEEINKNSKERLKSNSTFKLINENAERLKKQRDNSKQTLNLEKYRKEQDDLKEVNKAFNEKIKQPTGLTVFSLAKDLPLINSDTSKIARTKEWHKDLKKDNYIKEAFTILEEIK